jgi:hypothetical protein
MLLAMFILTTATIVIPRLTDHAFLAQMGGGMLRLMVVQEVPAKPVTQLISMDIPMFMPLR